jgi:CHAT domain-containing protein
LGADEVLLSIVVGDRLSHVWLATSNELRWRVIPLGTREIEERVARLRCGLDETNWQIPEVSATSHIRLRLLAATQARRRARCVMLTGVAEPDGLLPFDLAAAHQLYIDLVGDFAPLLRNRHVLLVNSGALTMLPFGVLLTEPPPNDMPLQQALEHVQWLGLQNPITLLPAVSSLRALRRTQLPASAVFPARLPYVAFANPVVTGRTAADTEKARLAAARSQCSTELLRVCAGDQGGSRSAARSGGTVAGRVREFSPLPQTACEVCSIAEQLGLSETDARQHIRIGARATRGEVLALGRDELKRYRNVHFATHGVTAGAVIRDGRPEPGLILTPGDESAAPRDDGFLSASDVAGLELDADWVILSACNTAAGDDVDGEALSGLVARVTRTEGTVCSA